MAKEDWIETEWMRRADHTSATPCLFMTVNRMRSPFYEGERFAVREGRLCLSLAGEMDYEPLPSSRDDDYYELHRFKTFEAAIDAAEEYRRRR